ncbi:ribosome-associated translation inhibitor RaiA [Polaribacter sp. Hel_I_88]|uniref:ribosome hibernation-promoting factor, HPF/YfiA family n=1 Tax=Polaribacter sp. Hel_I_88 TaxID=1250006 RepID=UPI00047DA9ED|nr:ribosome-associated translation inhibitor RaiA [Polaribacter sp. Hel_I_88]
MKINIQFVTMPTSETMQNYAIEKLEKMARKYDSIISVEVFFKKENDPKGNGKICEMVVSLSGPRIFASSNEKNFEVAVKSTISDLEKQLEKRKAIAKPYA